MRCVRGRGETESGSQRRMASDETESGSQRRMASDETESGSQRGDMIGYTQAQPPPATGDRRWWTLALPARESCKLVVLPTRRPRPHRHASRVSGAALGRVVPPFGSAPIEIRLMRCQQFPVPPAALHGPCLCYSRRSMIIPSGRGYSPRMGHGMGTVREIPTTGGASNQRFSVTVTTMTHLDACEPSKLLASKRALLLHLAGSATASGSAP
jgi:hypothetical protein